MKMRKKATYVVAMACAFFALTSCQKEFSLDTGTIAGTDSTTTTGGGTTSGTGCKACSYIPVCSGSKYTYSDTSFGTATSRNADYNTTGDTVVGPITYTKIFSNGQESYVSCINGETSQAVFNIAATGPNGPTTIPKIVVTVLKANAAVGTSWIDTAANAASQTIYYKYSIVEKSVSRMVAGKTYPDVIHVHLLTTLVAPLIGSYDTNTSEYYFAKSVGMVEYSITDATSGSVYVHSVLVSYNIP